MHSCSQLMKIIFINLKNTPNHLKNFIHEHRKRGNHVIRIKGVDKNALVELITSHLQEFEQEKTLAVGCYDVDIYDPQSNIFDSTQEVNGASSFSQATMTDAASIDSIHPLRESSFTWKLHFIHSKDMFFADYWLEERQKLSAIILSQFFSRNTAYSRIQKKDEYSARPWKRMALFEQRMHQLSNALKDDNVDASILHSAAFFMDQWGNHIAEINPAGMKRHWIDHEKQFNKNHAYNLYFRGDEFNHKSSFVNAYIKTFDFSMMTSPVESLCCIPIDYCFDELLNTTLSSGHQIISDSQSASLSTEHHYLLICPSKKEAKAILPKIQKLGLIPTPTKMRHRILQHRLGLHPVFDAQNQTALFDVEPFDDLSSLLASKTFMAYEKLSAKNNPEQAYINIFCSAYCNMLKGLNEQQIHSSVITEKDRALLKHSYGFIKHYMDWTLLYEKDHRRITNISEWLMEEIIFILIILKPYHHGDFSSIMKEELNHLHGNILEQKHFDFNVGLFNSGMRSFFEAFTAALSFHSNPTIVYTDNIYYEIVETFWGTSIHAINYFHNPNHLNTNADIYIMNPTMTYNENFNHIYPINPTEFINRIFSGRSSDKPATILIDSTLVDKGGQMIKDMLFHQSERLEQGLLNIVCFDSLQKFGMLATDKVQAGFVWAINHPQKFADFNQRITDLSRQNRDLDEQLMCLLVKYAYPQLRDSLLLSCRNGQFLRDFIPSALRIHQHNEWGPFLYLQTPTYFAKGIDEFSIFRGSFGFSNMVLTELNTELGYDIRLAAGYEGESKLKASLASIIYPNNSIERALRDLIDLLKLPELHHNSTDNLLKLFSKLSYLYQPCFRTLLCENANDLIRFIKVITKDININGNENHYKESDLLYDVIYKTYQFDFLNLFLRFHNIPMPPEFYGNFYKRLNVFKSSILYTINKLIKFSKIIIPFATVTNDTIAIDIEELIRFRNALKEKGRTFENLIQRINNYLIIHSYSKFQKLPIALHLLTSMMCHFIIPTSPRFNNELLYGLPFSTTVLNNPSISNLPEVILVNPRASSKYAIHVFFEKLDDAINFVEKNNIQNHTSTYDFIDAHCKYATDPYIARLYQRYVVKISYEQYNALLQQNDSYLPPHNSRDILDCVRVILPSPKSNSSMTASPRLFNQDKPAPLVTLHQGKEFLEVGVRRLEKREYNKWSIPLKKIAEASDCLGLNQTSFILALENQLLTIMVSKIIAQLFCPEAAAGESVQIVSCQVLKPYSIIVTTKPDSDYLFSNTIFSHQQYKAKLIAKTFLNPDADTFKLLEYALNMGHLQTYFSRLNTKDNFLLMVKYCCEDWLEELDNFIHNKNNNLLQNQDEASQGICHA